MKCAFDKLARRNSSTYLDTMFFNIATNISKCDYFIEAGAFEASASTYIKSRLLDCQVYAFEANPYNYAHFKDSLNDITYEHCAISNIEGNITFNIQIENNGTKVSPIKMDNSVTARVKKGLTYKEITVPCTTLNSYFLKKNVINAGLWIDVEGHGLEVLEGATDILKNTNVLKIEVEDREYWKNQRLSTDIESFLRSLDFTPVMRDFQSPKQYNVLFCSNKIFGKVKGTYV